MSSLLGTSLTTEKYATVRTRTWMSCGQILFHASRGTCMYSIPVSGSDGQDYWFLLKGHEDPRQDERVMQLFGLVNNLLLQNPATCKNNLTIQVHLPIIAMFIVAEQWLFDFVVKQMVACRSLPLLTHASIKIINSAVIRYHNSIKISIGCLNREMFRQDGWSDLPSIENISWSFSPNYVTELIHIHLFTVKKSNSFNHSVFIRPCFIWCCLCTFLS